MPDSRQLILENFAKNQHDPATLRKTLAIREYFPHPRSQVAVHREQEQTDMGSHRHEFLEIVFIQAGHGWHVTGDSRHEVGPGDVFVINNRRSHGYEQTRGLQLVNILVRDDALHEARRELGSLPGFHTLFTLEPVRWRRRDFTARMRLTPREMRVAGEWITALEIEALRDAEGGRFLARSWLMLIVGFLARCQDGRPDRPGEPDRRLARVLSRIDAQPEAEFRLSEMARDAAMSERSFLRHFREATGCSPSDYIIRARIRLARHLLDHEDPRMPVTEIAFRCGFNDSNYFARQFRRVTGASPRSYRASAG